MTTETAASTPPLILARIAGPDAPRIEAAAGRPLRIGRALDSDCCLVDPTVSRQHCTISCRAGRWFITDLGSRAGTLLNAVAVTPQEPAPLEIGDLVTIGPWIFRIALEDGGPVSVVTVDDAADPGRWLETIREDGLAGMAQQRLSLLLDYASELNKARSETELAHVVLRCALAGSGLSRAAVVRPVRGGEQIELIASMNADPNDRGGATYSRSLVKEAAAGRVARMNSRAVADVAVSIAGLGIHSALAAPIAVDGAVVACLYLDARGDESRVQPDAADFCIALARLCGLAYANQKRDQLESRRRVLEAELTAAREAQQLIVPASGRIGRVVYRVAMRPGSFVAGDLFDVVALPGGRVAIAIGDVTGHGVGAGILMAATQAYLNSALLRFGEPAPAVAAASAYIASHSPENRFVSLWVGVIDPEGGRLTYVDAGHGHWRVIDPDRGVRAVESVGGPPLGIVPDFEYAHDSLPFTPGHALFLYSDGVAEQQSSDGEQFGHGRIAALLAGALGEDFDPAGIIAEVLGHAPSPALDDDATAAIVRVV